MIIDPLYNQAMHNERNRLLQREISSIRVNQSQSQPSNIGSVPVQVPATAPQPPFSRPNGSPSTRRPVPSTSASPSSSSSSSSSHKSNGHMTVSTVSTKAGTRGGSFGSESPPGGSYGGGGGSRSHIPPPPPPLSYMSVYSGLFNSSMTTTGTNNSSMQLHNNTSKNKGKTNTPLVTTLMIKRTNSAGNAGICIPKMIDKISTSS